jgi:hypothetical protein
MKNPVKKSPFWQKEPEKNNIGDYRCEGKGVFKKPDIILISAGGNDVKFAKMVASVFSKPIIRWFGQMTFVGATVNLNKVLAELKKDDNPVIASSYGELKIALEHLVNNQKDIILTGYPSPENDENRKECSAKQTQSKIFKSLIADTKLMAKVTEIIIPKLNSIMFTATEKAGWSFIDRDRLQKNKKGTIQKEKFDSHGICAGPPSEYKIPTAINKYGRPTKVFVYQKKARWFLTLDDAYLAINQIARKPLKSNIRRGSAKKFYVGASGAMHPNSYGAAATADVIYSKMIKRLTN